jgi:hypothetical protein
MAAKFPVFVHQNENALFERTALLTQTLQMEQPSLSKDGKEKDKQGEER